MYRFLVFIMFISCTSKNEISKESPYVMILGVAQDAGYPQINCKKNVVNLLGKISTSIK